MARKTFTEEEIQKRIDSLSEEAADFLYSPEMGLMVKQIADRHKLHIDQMSLLDAEVGELMLGLTEPLEFVPNMKETLQIDEATAQAIAKEINDQVMMKMRGLMGAPSQQPAATAPTPSVVMPSSPKPVAPPIATPAAPIIPKPVVPAPIAAPVTAPKPAPAPNLMAAEAMLSEKKVTTSAPAAPSVPAAPAKAAPITPAPKADPAQPQNYKADPYREPVE